MKLDLLKKLIKEAVKEAVREEMDSILSESVGTTTKSVETVKYQPYQPPRKPLFNTGDPIADILNETRNNMTQAEYSNMTAGYSDMQNFNNNTMQQFTPGPEPGIDLSTLDFVKNAGAIYKASVDKDKQRFGG